MPAASPNGTSRAPHNRLAEPLTNGDNGRHPLPLTNGDNGAHHAPPAVPSTNGNNGRDAGGRFGKGNPGGPGNPFARRVAELRRVLLSTVTEDDIRAVTRRLVELTLAGDMAAARVLLAYAIGKPVEVVDPDTLDLQEWALLRQTPVNSDDMLRALTGMPLDVACLIVRTALPQIAAGTARLAQEKLRADPAEHGGKKSGAKPARKSAGKAQRKRR